MIANINKKVIATKQIAMKAEKLIQKKYGSNGCDGQTPLAYHNLNHTLMVSFATDLLYLEALKRKKISEHSIIYLRIAASLHDIEQKAPDNEQASAEIAAFMMLEANIFEESEIKLVKNLILGTKAYEVNNQFYQAAKNMGYLEKIIADADLAHLGGNNSYFKILFERYLEEKYNGSPRPSKRYLYHKEMNFLDKHSYLTEEANYIFNNKPENIEFCARQIGLHSYQRIK